MRFKHAENNAHVRRTQSSPYMYHSINTPLTFTPHRRKVEASAFVFILTFGVWPWNLFSNVHSHGNYLCKVSLKSLLRIWRDVAYIGVNARTAVRQTWQHKASRCILLAPEAKIHTCSYMEHCVREKEIRMFFCNIFYKTWAILMKYGVRSFLNKFAFM